MAASKTGYLTIQNFRFGLDARRSELTSQPGTLLRCVDCHINQGAEIEKRKAIVKTAMPAGVFLGLAGLSTQYTFGSIAPPSMPVGFTYQQLTSPLNSAMTALVGATLFNNEPFVVATFGAEGTYAFFNGTRVSDFTGGLVLTGFTTNPNQATELISLINNTTNYTAFGSGSDVTIVGTNGNQFSVTDTVTSANGVITAFQENNPVSGVQATAAVGTFTISACAPGTGATLANVNFVYVKGVATSILFAPVIATTTPDSMAAAVAAGINAAFATNGGYSALANGNVVSVYAPAGAQANGFALHVGCQNSTNNDGGVCTESCTFTFNLGTGAMSISNVASAQQGNIDTTTRASGSFGTVELWLKQIATDIMTTAGQFSAVGIGNQLYISLNGDDSRTVYTDTITLTFTSSGGAVVNGISTLSAKAVPQTVGGGQQVIVIASGGLAPYSYSWTISNPTIFMSSQTSNINSFFTNTPIQTLKGIPIPVSAFANCAVTDSAGSKVTVTVVVRITLNT